MAQRQTVTDEERLSAMGIDPTWVQCAGCPEEQWVQPAPRVGHRSSCEECVRHCQCDTGEQK